MARLIINTSAGAETIDLQPGEVVTVGRDASNRIPLPDDTQASRRHCRIGPREGGVEGWEVVDLGATNKTRVNGAAIERRVLSDGDVVEVGHARSASRTRRRTRASPRPRARASASSSG